MASSNKFEIDHMYFYVYDGDPIIGYYVEEINHDFQEEYLERRLEELWCYNEEDLIYTTYVNSETHDDIDIIKHLGHVDNDHRTINQIVQDLTKEYPEYFI